MLAVISLSPGFDPDVRASFMEAPVSSQSCCLKAQQFYLPTGVKQQVGSGRICFETDRSVRQGDFC